MTTLSTTNPPSSVSDQLVSPLLIQPHVNPNEKIDHYDCGHLTIFHGNMYSGKTSKLLTELARHADCGLKVLFINHADDDRKGDGKCSTHNSQYTHLSPKIIAVKSAKLLDVDVSSYDVIGIDEGQFFVDLISAADFWVVKEKKIVYCAGLDGDFLRRPIGHLLDLIPKADHCEKLTAKCRRCLDHRSHCHVRSKIVDAPFTARIVEGSEQKVIGGQDMYIPLCRAHYELHIAKMSH